MKRSHSLVIVCAVVVCGAFVYCKIAPRKIECVAEFTYVKHDADCPVRMGCMQNSKAIALAEAKRLLNALLAEEGKVSLRERLHSRYPCPCVGGESLDEALKHIRVEVAEQPTEGAVALCRIAVSGKDEALLTSIAWASVDFVKGRVSDENEMRMEKAAYEQYQEKFRLEREMQRLKSDSRGDADSEARLSKMAEALSAAETRIAEVRKQVMAVGLPRISQVAVRLQSRRE